MIQAAVQEQTARADGRAPAQTFLTDGSPAEDGVVAEPVLMEDERIYRRKKMASEFALGTCNAAHSGYFDWIAGVRALMAVAAVILCLWAIFSLLSTLATTPTQVRLPLPPAATRRTVGPDAAPVSPSVGP